MRLFLLLALGILGGAAPVWAQNTPDEKPRPVFEQLFPLPKEDNGFEELMQAGDLARNSQILNDAIQPDATLTLKRKALNDPDVRRALSLIHAAFLKPIRSPRDPAKLTFETAVFPHFAVFRNLARLFSIVEYVALADGRTEAALDALDDCLRLSRAIPADSIISALVFVAVDAIAVKLIAVCVAQFSYRDCGRLEQLCADWLRDTDSFASALTGERNMSMRQFQEAAPKPDDLLKIMNPFADEANADTAEETPEEKALKLRLRDHPDDAGKIWRQAREAIGDFYETLIAESKKEAWERKPIVSPKIEPAVRALTDNIMPTFAQVLSKQDQNRANLHLLGTFAALGRYRWIHRHYPDSLMELHEPALTQDPFTGNALIYKRDGDAYDLHSAGPFDADGKTRTLLYLPYRRVTGP